MTKTKVAFWRTGFFSAIQRQLNFSHWLDKSRPSKKATFVLLL